ncbi:MAG: 1-deoxy-D-xylulose-5-phosphate reductoisomerase [Planctomycetota bacterium]|nr:MAG: 1-deoxy-D-xylulose-5-phosphate reductoisomerase [Planctomycetota bacterium]
MASPRRRLVILGATGTVGRQAQEILEQAGSPLQVVALSAHQRRAELEACGSRYPEASLFLTSLPQQSEALQQFLLDGDYDLCLQAMVGAAGLPFSEAVLLAGKDLALANKESLVMAGGHLVELSKTRGGNIVPVDSEHCAIHQCLPAANDQNSIRRLYLTASGGALRDWPLAQLGEVSPEQALAHPNWDMGPRITVDSATMMNKALEILEAQHLFGVDARSIQVLLHRQSVIHSMVEFVDGSVLAQMGPPDMAFPIHYALHFPQRLHSPLSGFHPELFSQLTLQTPESKRYPALELGWRAAEKGDPAGAVLNAADEVAVAAFLKGRIRFPEIAEICAATLESMPALPASTLDDIYAADRWAREHSRARCEVPAS